MKGLLEPSIEIIIDMEPEGSSEMDAQELKKNREFVKAHWMLGPEKTAGSNSDYWRELATKWRIAPDQARRNLCANCEYFNDTPDMLAQMEQIPEDAYDKDGGGRGFCVKFDFICHNLRTCQAWEKAEFKEEGEGYENGEMEQEDGND
jgi:hypothetical protein